MMRTRTGFRGLRALLAAMAAAAMVAMGAPAALADDATASITGTVVHASDGSPVVGASVEARTADGLGYGVVVTEADGSYLLPDLPAGDYSVTFDATDQGLVLQYWSGVHQSWEAETVTVGTAEDVVGVDASLILGGSIEGTVTTDAEGSPVPGVSVSANGESGFFASGVTDEDGRYRIDGLMPDDYTISFRAEDGSLIAEYWQDATEYWEASRVTVAEGDAISGIDAALAAGGSISGSVTRASDGSPVDGVEVQISGTGGASGSAFTDADGFYAVDGLVPGAYTVWFRSADGSLVEEYWDAATDAADALRVQVTAGQQTTGIDASMEPAATISGTVSHASDGSPVQGEVTALNARGIGQGVRIGEDGRYSMFVQPGSYAVQFRADDPALLIEYWDDASTLAEATPIGVGAGEARDDVDATLEAGFGVSGVVRADGVGVADVQVTAEGEDGATDVTSTDADGSYTLYVSPGTYVVATGEVAGDPFYAAQYHPAAATRSEAEPVEVSDAGISGIDFDLAVGGDIRGRVSVQGGIDPSSEGLTVVAYRWSAGAWTEVGRTPTWGDYAFNGWGSGSGPLPAGEYRIGVETAECTHFYGSRPDGDSIDLAAGEVVEGIDITVPADCEPPTAIPALHLSVASALPGADVGVTGSGFGPGEQVRLELHSTPLPLGTLTADDEGRIRGTLTIPATAPVGAHRVVAIGTVSGFEASVAITVLPGDGAPGGDAPAGSGAAAGQALAETGAAGPTLLLAAALGLVVLGAFLTRRSVFVRR